MNQHRPYVIDINNDALPQTGATVSSPVARSASLPRSSIEWFIAIRRFDGSSYMLVVPLNSLGGHKQALDQVRDQLVKVFSPTWYEHILSILFTRTAVGTARVRRIMACDPSPHIRFRVNLHDYEHDALLTEILHNRNSVLLESEYRLEDSPFAFNSSRLDGYYRYRIIVFQKLLDKQKVAGLLISLLLISPALGLVVGTYLRRADVGVAVSAGVFALASFLQGLAAWFAVD